MKVQKGQICQTIKLLSFFFIFLPLFSHEKPPTRSGQPSWGFFTFKSKMHSFCCAFSLFQGNGVLVAAIFKNSGDIGVRLINAQFKTFTPDGINTFRSQGL